MTAPKSSPYRTPSMEASHCLLCGSEGEPGEACATCLVARPLLAPEPAVVRACPRCQDPLVAMPVGGGASAHVCTRCHGMFAAPRAWARLWKAPEVAADLERRFPPVPGQDLTPLVACSTCRTTMERARFSATSDVVIDFCDRGHGIWLDAGELGRVLSYAEHKARIGQDAARREAEEAWARANENEELRRKIALEVSLVQGEHAGRQYTDGLVRATGRRWFFDE